MGLLLSTYHIHKLTRSVERDIASSNAELEDNMTKLQNLQEEMEEMDSFYQSKEHVSREVMFSVVWHVFCGSVVCRARHRLTF